MRIRSIKPEFWRSDDIAALPISARLTFIGLWSYVDDNGVGSAKLSSIVADLYAEDMAADPPETLRRVSGDLQTLSERGLIVQYEVDGKRLLYVVKWTTHQVVNKPSKGHGYPLPTAEMMSSPVSVQTPSGDSPETLRPGAGEQGNRGTGEKDLRPPVLDVTNDRAPARNEGGAVVALHAPRGGQQVAQRLNATARSATAHQIAVAFSESLPTPLEGGVLTKVGIEIDNCLKAGIPPPAIAEGLRAWTESDSWSPTQIPNFVHKASSQRAGRRRGRSKPTEKAVDAHAAAEELLQEVKTLGDRSQ